MPYQTPITIKQATNRIWSNKYVLPAIQREFVWDSDQITALFDSLMRGFPVGSFLSWKVQPETVKKFRFYRFMSDFHERDQRHCQPLGDIPGNSEVLAILDGQQRLTSLNIGLNGSLAEKLPNKRWSNDDAFPKTRLYLNLLQTEAPAEDDTGLQYAFAFKTDSKAKEENETGACWFAVRDVARMSDVADLHIALAERSLGNDKTAIGMLYKLHKVIHVENVIAFYEEESQDIETVLNIFIRTNSGGTVLSYSDLLLSIATSQWGERDARQEIHGLVDELNDIRHGFTVSKDFVLKAGLMLTDIASVGFRISNFNRQNMAVLEKNWDAIADSLRTTFKLAASFGLSRDCIWSYSPFLVLAYYIHRRGLGGSFVTSPQFASDRATIRSWLLRSMLKPGVWGSGLDVTLTALREPLRDENLQAFPAATLEKVLRTRGRTLQFTDEEVDDLADMPYGDRRTVPLLLQLFPFVDTSVNEFHVDHIFPRGAFHRSKLKGKGFTPEAIDELQDKKERLANLQLLTGPLNQSKSDHLPDEWLNNAFSDDNSRAEQVRIHKLGDVRGGISAFSKFYERRRGVLRTEIATALGGSEFGAEAQATA